MDINLSGLNWFDITIISVVCASTLFAVLRGFVKSIFSLFTWIAASVVAIPLYPHVLPMVMPHVHSDKVAMAIASFGTFSVLFIIFAITSYKMVHMMDGFRGGIIDRLLGLGFGFARGVVIVCFVFFSINMTSEMLHFGSESRPGPEWFASAKTYSELKRTTARVFAMLPEDVPTRIVQYVNKFKEASMAGIDDDNPNGLPRTLNPEERKIMKKVIAALPKEELAEIYKRYEGGAEGISDIQKLAIFREIVTRYNKAVSENKIAHESVVPEDEIQVLDKALNGAKEQTGENTGKTEDETGYQKQNIKQLDRLIDNVDEGAKEGKVNGNDGKSN
jgi:membrane protein required for colicin V production